MAVVLFDNEFRLSYDEAWGMVSGVRSSPFVNNLSRALTIYRQSVGLVKFNIFIEIPSEKRPVSSEMQAGLSTMSEPDYTLEQDYLDVRVSLKEITVSTHINDMSFPPSQAKMIMSSTPVRRELMYLRLPGYKDEPLTRPND